MPVMVQRTEFKGWQNCWRIANQTVELIVTADVGPRVIFFGFTGGGRNLFKNFESQMGRSGEAEWMIRGGSRIWIAPEDRVASYAPDNTSVEIEVQDGGLTATAPVEEPVRVQKQMVIHLDGCRVEIVNRVKNAGLLPVEFAVWVLTVMAPGGVAVTGFPPRGTHPEDLVPSNPLIMWPFTDLTDPRWKFLRKYLVLRQDPANTSPQKLGHFNPDTWGAYFLDGDLFVKRAKADPSRRYPDFGASFETFTNAEILELETLGPLCLVGPEEWIEQTEQWELRKTPAPASWTDAELDTIFGSAGENGR
jgi:hypothetical protein